MSGPSDKNRMPLAFLTLKNAAGNFAIATPNQRFQFLRRDGQSAASTPNLRNLSQAGLSGAIFYASARTGRCTWWQP